MLTLFTAAALATGAIGDLKVYRDWIVGCENMLACHATTLDPETNEDTDANGMPFPDNNLRMSMKRGAGMHDEVRIQFMPDPFSDPGHAADPALVRGLTIRGHGNQVMTTIRLTPAEAQSLSIPEGPPADVSSRIVNALGTGEVLELYGPEGDQIAVISLRGAREAMQHMDAAQHRVGNVTALLDRGDAPAYLVPPRPPMPPIVVPLASPLPPRQPERFSLLGLMEKARCKVPHAPDPELTSFRLDERTSLLMVVASCAPYNNEGYIYTVANDGTAQPAGVRYSLGEPPLEQPLIGVWLEDDGLHSFGRGRGLGDCGEHQIFAWDGHQFLLSQFDVMGECRGSLDYITLFRRPVESEQAPSSPED